MTGGDMKEQQGRLLSAAKEAGTIKRFLPSEYGYEYGSIRTFAAGVNALFQGKMDVRKQLAGTGCVPLNHRSQVIQSYAASPSKTGFSWSFHGILAEPSIAQLHNMHMYTAKGSS